MVMLMIRIVGVWMRVAGAVLVEVLVLVEHDLKPPPKCISDAAQGGEAWDMISALKARDHRLRHVDTLRQLPLGLTREGAKFEQAVRALGGDRGAVIERSSPDAAFSGLPHRTNLAKVRSPV